MAKDKDANVGVYNKYFIHRTDGGSRAGHKHANCRYYVLDLDHDKFSAAALKAYARACAKEFPLLAKDLRLMAKACILRATAKPGRK